MTPKLLDRLPQDILAVLTRAPGLEGLPVLGPSREAGSGAISEQVSGALGKGTLVPSGGAVGLAIWIGDLEAEAAEVNLPGVVLEARIRVTVLENMVLNSTGKTALDVAAAVAGALHQWSPGENVLILPDRPFMAPTLVGDEQTGLPDPDLRGYELTWKLPSFGLEVAARTRGPSASYNDGLGQLTITAPEGQIWYTLDDQGGVPALPAPGEPQATLYSTPITVAPGTTVRAASYLDGYQPSQVLMMTI